MLKAQEKSAFTNHRYTHLSIENTLFIEHQFNFRIDRDSSLLSYF